MLHAPTTTRPPDPRQLRDWSNGYMPFAKPFISWTAQEIRLSEAPGIYHPVKELVAPAPSAADRNSPIS